MAAVSLLNMSITQAGVKDTSRLIHPGAEPGQDPGTITDFSADSGQQSQCASTCKGHRHNTGLCSMVLRGKRQTALANDIEALTSKGRDIGHRGLLQSMRNAEFSLNLFSTK